MALLCQPGAEPIAGYQLVQRLGMGGYGEVWKATAPGGLAKAIKIVYGHMRDARAEQELKSLGRIKEVRHPFILSLERFEVIENQLVIVMELADRNLLERFQECQQAGLPGIPRQELLAYLRDAAEALDYMGEHYGLQHLDIKPQNLLLVGGRVKLADFGLVKDLENSSASATGGITAIYATPEAFDGRVSRYSDQYSLAIVYQEMLTGSRPFPGTTPLQLAAQHSKCPPMLGSLPPQDRPTIARALSKIPDQRFPTCGEMVQSLLQAGGEQSPLPKVRGAAAPPPAGAELLKPAAAKTPAPAASTDSGLTEATIIRAQPSPSPLPSPAVEEASAGGMAPAALPLAAARSLPRPTLFLGAGGIAAWTLKRLRQRLQGCPGDRPALPFRLLLLDTDRESLQWAEQGEGSEALQSGETLLLPLRRPEHYRPQSQTLLRWLDRRWLYNIPRSQRTEGARPLGRLAFVDHAADVLARLREHIGALRQVPAEAAPGAADGLGLRDDGLQVFLIASMSGGTGSGMLLSLAYAVQQVCAEFQLTNVPVCALLVHATSPRRSEQELARLNAYATLVELQHLSGPDASYPGDPEQGLNAFGPGTPPVRDTYIVHLGDQLDRASAEAATACLAEYLYLSAATEMGAVLDQWRQHTRAAVYGQESQSPLRIFGLHRLSFPRFAVAARAAGLFCKELIDRWCGQSGWESDGTERQALTQIAALGLDAENLGNQLQAAVLRVFGEPPEQTFRRILAEFPLEQTPPASDPSAIELTRQALEKIDIFLGPGVGAPGESRVVTPVDVELTSQAKALAEQLGRSFIEWLLTLVEDPRKRLKAAHYAARRSAHHLSEECAKLHGQLVQLRRHRARLRSHFSRGDFGRRSSGIPWLGNLRGQRVGSAPKQKLIAYCWLRLHESVLENIVEVLHSVGGRIARFLHDSERGEEALRQLGATLDLAAGSPAAVREPRSSASKSLTELFPGQCQNREEAARYLLEHFGPKLTALIEQQLQRDVLDPRGGLWGLLSTTAEPVHRVQKEIERRVLAAFVEAAGHLDAAQLLLESRHDADRALGDLLACIGAVTPDKQVPRGWQHLVLALPTSPEARLLGQLLDPLLADVPHTVVGSDSDIVLCYESAQLPLQQMAEILLGDAVFPADAACHVLTRHDIAWTPLLLRRQSVLTPLVPAVSAAGAGAEKE